MRRVILSIGLPLFAAVLMWGVRGKPCGATSCETFAQVPPLQPATPSCKPEGPIAVSLVMPDDGAGRARFSVRPLLEMSELRWSWELSRDVQVLEGDALGVAASERGATTEGEARLSVPNDGLHHTARLVVTGVLRAQPADADGDGEPDSADAVAAEPELVTVTRTLSWGEPEPVVPLVLSPDADTGTMAPVGVVPSTHVPAAAAPRGVGR